MKNLIDLDPSVWKSEANGRGRLCYFRINLCLLEVIHKKRCAGFDTPFFRFLTSEPTMGFEPTTYALRMRCSTS